MEVGGWTMQLHKALVLLALAAILVWGTAAQDEPVKIGIVDIDQVINSAEEGKAARQELERKQREAQAEIEPMYERYREQEEDLKQKRFVLSEEALFQKQLDLAEMRSQIQNKGKELEDQLKLDQARIEGPIKRKLAEIIQETGKSAGFTLILQRGGAGMLYAREALDITDMIVEKYNQKG
jgi:outer membrane protein